MKLWCYLLFVFHLLDLSEAREAFIKQFTSLEASTGRLLAQLHGITSTLNCSLSVTENEMEENRTADGARGVCGTFAEAVLAIRGSQEQLRQATLDLNTVVKTYRLFTVR